MAAQHVFYIIGSIALGLLGLFLIVATVALMVIVATVKRTARHIQGVSYEIRELIRSGKSYTRYLGANFMAKTLGTVLNIIKKLY